MPDVSGIRFTLRSIFADCFLGLDRELGSASAVIEPAAISPDGYFIRCALNQLEAFHVKYEIDQSEEIEKIGARINEFPIGRGDWMGHESFV